MAKKKDINIFQILYDQYQQLKRMNMGEIPQNILNTMDIIFANDDIKPVLIKDGAKPYSNGWHFIFTLNPGSSFQKCYSKIDYFKSVINDGLVDMYQDGKFLHIDVNTYKFEKQYKFNTDDIFQLLENPKYRKMYIPIVVGVKSGGKLLVVEIADIPHILVAGINKSGKSSWIKQLLWGISLLRPNAIIIYLDFKGADAWSIDPIGITATEIPEARRILDAVTQEVRKRNYFLKQNRMSKIHSIKEVPPILLAVDEITQMKDKICQEMLRDLLMISRNSGVSIVAGTQKPSHKTYADFCESRSQFEARMCFRLSESKDSRLVLDNSKAYDMIPANCGGRGIWSFSDDKVIQSLFIDDHDIANMTREYEPVFAQRRDEGWIAISPNDRLLP